MIRRRLPEVVQTSAMDCGPAALASLLSGCGVRVSYPRLRELCQTDVDGTSIDTLEALAVRFGLDAEQVMLPNDFILRRDGTSLPCIVVTTLPNGLTHFIVAWRERFGFVQIMDPARGRSWISKRRFLEQLYQHGQAVPADDWLAYARDDEFRCAVADGLGALGLRRPVADALVAEACAAGGWRPIAELDAAVRLVRTLRSNRQLGARPARRLLRLLVRSPELIPEPYYQVHARSGADGELLLRGAVLIRVAGGRAAPPADDAVVNAARGRPQASLGRRLVRLLGELGGARLITAVGSVSVLVGVITFIEALVFRYLIGADPPADLPTLLLVAGVVILPLLAAIALEAGGMSLANAIGRQLDVRLRASLLEKLPRITDGYFTSRLASDLAERGQAASQVRELPELLRQGVIATSRILLILAGLVWLLPQQVALVSVAALVALAAPLAAYPTLAERDLRVRTHLGALTRFYLDGLRGSEAIWAHGADGIMRREQEGLLVRWATAARQFQRPALAIETVQIVVLVAVSVLLVQAARSAGMALGSVLLVAYWSLFLPILSRQVSETLKQIPPLGNVARRVLELLDAPEEVAPASAPAKAPAGAPAPGPEPSAPAADPPGTPTVDLGAAIRCVGLTVARGDITVLDHLDLAIEPGERVAVVGASGSGKSTFLGTLLGWHALRSGALLLDGRPADPVAIAELREQSVLVDADAYLWNRSLLESIVYGCETWAADDLQHALNASELVADLERMERGLATVVGENGSRLSGGECQRLRIARALVRRDRRLVLLDEPFTGMDSAQRERLGRACARRWPGATTIWVSHNVAETVAFPRVLVFEAGRVVEDDVPRALLARGNSRYAELVARERRLAERLGNPRVWAPCHVASGRLDPRAAGSGDRARAG